MRYRLQRVPSHTMLEAQTYTVYEGERHQIKRTSADRSGRARFRQRGAVGDQTGCSTTLPESWRQASADLETRALKAVEPLKDVARTMRLHILRRRHEVDGTTAGMFEGYWGSCKVADGWPTVFGSLGGKIVYRRGPWVTWPFDLPREATVKPDVPILLSPYCATLFHEAVGHAVEAEYLADSPLAARLGQRIACDALNMLDQPDLEDCAGTMTVDDAGRPASATTMVHRGFLVGDLGHDQGVLRRASYRDPLMVRASNFVIGPGSGQPQEWIKAHKELYFVAWIESGNWRPGGVRCKALTGPVFRLEHGKPVGCLDWTMLNWDSPHLLESVASVGHDFQIDPVVHWCVKRDQRAPIGMASPSILLRGLRP